ncbi:V-type ATP synthase subunit E [Candidatus Kaiserbacteria bacterium]|nr:V-type ATP synthase subunit E [Candidatus Kaiserbacteria bacterium]
MSQNTLIEKIKNDAAQAVEEIKAAGAAEISAIQSGIEAEVAKLSETHTVNLEKKKAQMELVAVSKAKQNGNIAVQTAKRKQINAVFDSVTEDLAGQDADAYVSFFVKYVKEIVPSDTEVEHVHAPTKRVDETTKIIKEAGLGGEVKADSAIKAGLVVRAKDGVYDVTLNRIMSEKRAELEMVVVNKVES